MAPVAAPAADCPPALVTSVQRALRRSGEDAPFSLRCDGRLVSLRLRDEPPVDAALTAPGLDEPWVAAALVRIVGIERSARLSRPPLPPRSGAPAVQEQPPPDAAPEVVPETRPRAPRTSRDPGSGESAPLPAPPRPEPVSYELRLLGQSMPVGPWVPGIEIVRRRGTWEQGVTGTAAWLGTSAGIVRAQQVGWTVGHARAAVRSGRTEVEWVPRAAAGLVALHAVPGTGASGAPSTVKPFASVGLDLTLRLRTAGVSAAAAGVRASVGAGPVATVDGRRQLSFTGAAVGFWLAFGGTR